jgi:hypothetical protein
LPHTNWRTMWGRVAYATLRDEASRTVLSLKSICPMSPRR